MGSIQADTSQRRRGRPRAPDVEERILDAARSLFGRDGYERVSMDAVATAAGVSKQTVYRRFKDKETLFAVIATRARESAGAEAAVALLNADPADPAGELARFGAQVLEVALDPEVAALRRVLIAELAHHPGLNGKWQDGAPIAAKEAIETYLRRAQDAALLGPGDPVLAADQFLTLVVATGQRESRHGLDPLTAAARRRIAREAAALIVRALS